MGNKAELNQLEQHLLKGLQSEKLRLENLSPLSRLQTSEDADPNEILERYEQLVRNYHPKNYSRHNPIVSDTAKDIVELLDEAKKSASKKWEDANLSSDISDIAFAANQSTDDIPESASNPDGDEAQTIPSYEAVGPVSGTLKQPLMNAASDPRTRPVPTNQYFNPPTGDFPHVPHGMPPQPYPPAVVPMAPNFAPNPPIAMTQPLPASPPVHYPTHDLPPHPIAAAGYSAIPSDPVKGLAYPIKDLPPVPGSNEFNDLQGQVRVLNHRALTAETRMRTMERVHREQTSLLESQLLAALHRAERAEQRLMELERRGSPADIGSFPVPPLAR
ncbi:MAG: hypothetical protein VYC39_12005 [Myxococcota bacterium]|nr:hypothetical protein [Myxococcota bacterium]